MGLSPVSCSWSGGWGVQHSVPSMGNSQTLPRVRRHCGGAGAGEEGGPGCVPLRGTLGTHRAVLVRDRPLSSLSVTSSFSLPFSVCLSLLPFPFWERRPSVLAQALPRKGEPCLWLAEADGHSVSTRQPSLRLSAADQPSGLLRPSVAWAHTPDYSSRPF